MNLLRYIVVLFSLICLPAIVFMVFWRFIIKRGWGSKWLLATSFTVVLSILAIVLSLGAQDNSMLLLLLGATILGGIGFYFSLRASPTADALIGRTPNIQNKFASLSEDEENNRKLSAKLAVKDILIMGLAQTMPIVIGIAILVINKDINSSIVKSLALFVMGFTGILRIVVRPKHIPAELYSSKSKIIGNVLITVVVWSLAVYGLFNK